MATPRDPSARSLPLGVQCHQQPLSYSLSAQGLLSGAHKSPGPDAQSGYLPALPPALVPSGGSEGAPQPQQQPLHPKPRGGGLLPAASGWSGPSGGGTSQFHTSGQVTNNPARSKCAKGAGTSPAALLENQATLSTHAPTVTGPHDRPVQRSSEARTAPAVGLTVVVWGHICTGSVPG